MNFKKTIGLALGGSALVVAVTATTVRAAPSDPPNKKHVLPTAQNGGTVIGLCDGKTSIEVQGPMTRQKAQSASDQLMKEWLAKNPSANWDRLLAESSTAKTTTPPGAAATTPATSSKATGAGAQAQSGAPIGKQPAEQGDVYGGYTKRDEMVWAEETARFIDEGNQIFHDAKKLGGTISVSCDMCHPNAANTHPETYPKYQVQLGRVALLRDMINWCIENPVKGKPLRDDDPKMRALEAYILSQRKGVKMEYGKH